MKRIIESQKTFTMSKTKSTKFHMIDYIVNIFSNNATKADCLKFCLEHLNITNVDVINEARFRSLLRRSSMKNLTELYYIATERYKHLSRAGYDKLDEKDSFSFSDSDDYNDYKQANSDLLSDIGNKIGDLESHLRDLVSTDTFQLNQDQLDAISQLEQFDPTRLTENVSSDLKSILNVLGTINDARTKNMALGIKIELFKK